MSLLLLTAMTASLLAADGQTGSWGDQGDGTFRNPIIAGDFSDPDAIRVGEDYYLVASTFESGPGVPVLHSRDLVNWRIISHALPDLAALGEDFTTARMQRWNKGVFAPSIRYHDGLFRVYVNLHSGEGFITATAKDPAGPWTVTQLRDAQGRPLRTHGWTDPCPVWGDDGTAALASSRPGKAWFGYLFQMSADGTQLLDADVTAMNSGDGPFTFPQAGTMYSPWHSTEGHKIYRRNGWWYLVHIEFLNKGMGRGTYVLRARHLWGTKPDGTAGKPGDLGAYEVRRFGTADAKGVQDIPGQGALVDTPDGRWFWLAQFDRYGTDGRTPCLMPVRWEDDWPVAGAFAWQQPKPIPGGTPTTPFLAEDGFDRPTLDPAWSWNHAPRNSHWSLAERPGVLRLRAFPPAPSTNGKGRFFAIGNVLNQRHYRAHQTVGTWALDLAGMTDGQEAGLAHFNGGKHYGLLGIRQQGGKRTWFTEAEGTVTPGGDLPAGDRLWLRSATGFDNVAHLSYSLDGTTFTPAGTYALQVGWYRGDMLGVYTTADREDAGWIDVDGFRGEVVNR